MPPRFQDRRRRRRLRLADHLCDRRLPRLPARGDHDLRARTTTRSRRTSSSPTTWGRPCCGRNRSRTSCRPTGRRSPSSRRGRGAACRRSYARRGGATTRACRTSWPRRGSSPARLGWDDQRYPAKVGWLQRGAASNGDTPHFVLFDEEARFIGRAKHVMLACGHGPLSFPPALAKARQDPAMADRIVQAYAPKEYDATGRYIVDRLGHRLGQRMGERDRRRRKVHLARPQPDAGRAGPEYAALLLRGVRHRRVPGARLRPAHRVPRPHPQGNRRRRAAAGTRRSRRAARRAASSS